ncbi:nicotinate phosphoribosyltransferase, partial [Cutibacterium acnes subsp. acnes]|nr:nicotinate phosphoribosyltransferase [Cutibacterium acnes subsp. acnes]
GSADRNCTFEVFGRRLPHERRYGVVAGTERVLDAITKFRFTEDQLDVADFLSNEARQYLCNYKFAGQIDGYREGDLY